MGRLPGGMASPFINCFSLLSQTGSIPSEGTYKGGFEDRLYCFTFYCLGARANCQTSASAGTSTPSMTVGE